MYRQLEFTNRAIAPTLTAFRYRAIKEEYIGVYEGERASAQLEEPDGEPADLAENEETLAMEKRDAQMVLVGQKRRCPSDSDNGRPSDARRQRLQADNKSIAELKAHIKRYLMSKMSE